MLSHSPLPPADTESIPQQSLLRDAGTVYRLVDYLSIHDICELRIEPPVCGHCCPMHEHGKDSLM